MEKADILELTVKHLRALQRQQAAGVMSGAHDVPGVVSKYRAGFNECAKEVVRYMGSVREMGEDTKERLLGHLAGCLQVVNHHVPTPVDSLHHQQLKPLHVHIPPPPPAPAAPQAGGVPPPPPPPPPPPSVIMRNPQTSFPAPMSFNPPVLSSSTAASAGVERESPVSTTPLSALPLQHVSAAGTASTEVSPSAGGGAFKIVPSSAAARGGAVALYLGGPPVSSTSTTTAPTFQRSDAHTPLSTTAVPLYSVTLPPQPVTAFVTPPLTSSTTSAMDSHSSRPCSDVTPPPSLTKGEPHSLPVDLRQTHKAVMDAAGYPVAGYGQCSPASLAEEKLWRPW